MKEYDLIVIGAGSGLDVATRSANDGKKVALIEPGPLGGTCLNRGCIPSKMLIYPADVLEEVLDAKKFDINAGKPQTDYGAIVRRVNKTIDADAESIAKGIANLDNLDLYEAEATFVDTRTVEVEGEKITAPKIVIAAGTRPFVPPIEGIDSVDYLTSKEALRLTDRPKSMIIIGGGYIAAELAHFFGTLGVRLTIIEQGDVLISNEDTDVAALFTELFSKKHKVILNNSVVKVEKTESGVRVRTKDTNDKQQSFEAELLFVATGRKPNTDTLKLKEAGFELTERGYVKNNEYLQTSADGVYTLGDIAGNYFFKHTANHEAGYVYVNLWRDKKLAVDYAAVPHAIFSSPEVAGVGKTEQQLKNEGVSYRIGKEEYKHTGMGEAMLVENGFVKVLLGEDDTILGCHIIGPHASILIHEVVVAMKYGGGKARAIRNAIHIHPALNEVVQRAFFKIQS